MHISTVVFKVQKLEELLEANISLFLERGGKLICRGFGDLETKTACALNTILINKNKHPLWVGPALRDEFYSILGLSFGDDEFFSFMRGFDGFAKSGTHIPEYWELGLKLRNKYLVKGI